MIAPELRQILDILSTEMPIPQTIIEGKKRQNQYTMAFDEIVSENRFAYKNLHKKRNWRETPSLFGEEKEIE